MASRRSALLMLALLCVLPAPQAFAMQDEGATLQGTPVQRIRANPQGFRDREASIVGKISRYVDEGDRETSTYYLEDDFGIQLRVLTRDALPPVDSRWFITGIIALDPVGDPYLVESGRLSQDAPPEVPLPVEAAIVEDVAPAGPFRSPLFLGGAGLLLLALLIWVMRSRSATVTPAPITSTGSYAPPPAPPGGTGEIPVPHHTAPTADMADFYDGRTVRFARPTTLNGTLKLLPGRLEVLSGPDKGNEVRLVHPGGATPEITFGRSEGPAFAHIQLTAPTVSRRHALMRFEAGTWNIANFSDTNPIVVNDAPLLDIGQGRVLSDGDTLEFGEVSFKFHAR